MSLFDSIGNIASSAINTVGSVANSIVGTTGQIAGAAIGTTGQIAGAALGTAGQVAGAYMGAAGQIASASIFNAQLAYGCGMPSACDIGCQLAAPSYDGGCMSPCEGGQYDVANDMYNDCMQSNYEFATEFMQY